MKTSFSRTFFLTAVVVLAALLMVGAAFQYLVRGLLIRQTERELLDDCTTVASLASAYYGEGDLETQDFFLDLSIATRVSSADAVICDKNGNLLHCSDSPMGCAHQGMVLSQDFLDRVFRDGVVMTHGVIDGLYEEDRYVVAKPILDTNNYQTVGLVIMTTPGAQAMAIMDKLADTYMIATLLVAVVAVLAITLLAHRQSAPLRMMAKAASDFGHGHLDARVEVSPNAPREMQELALSFNNMASSLQKSEYQRQDFVANVSHELKTPMTTISGYVDGMLDGTIPPERHAHYMELVSGETKRLSRLVRSMLDISRLQDQENIPEGEMSRFSVDACVSQVLISFEPKILEKNLEVDVDFPELSVYTQASRDAITQVVYNLVDNAVKFCPTGGLLHLQIREGGGKIFVSIANQGETIPPEELPLVFERFHKLDKSRAINREGWGLGLYIVKTLICRHGEDIAVTSQNGKTEFTFTLPSVN